MSSELQNNKRHVIRPYDPHSKLWLLDLPDSTSLVYFIRVVGTGYVKIGVSTRGNIETRLRDLQIGNPMELELAGALPGSFKDEQWLHRELKQYRMRGEWFDFSSPDHGDSDSVLLALAEAVEVAHAATKLAGEQIGILIAENITRVFKDERCPILDPDKMFPRVSKALLRKAAERTEEIKKTGFALVEEYLDAFFELDELDGKIPRSAGMSTGLTI